MRYIALFALVFLIGCAQVIEEENAESSLQSIVIGHG